MQSMKETMMDNKIFEDGVVELEDSVDESRKLLTEETSAIPVITIKKEQEGKYDALTWPVYLIYI